MDEERDEERVVFLEDDAFFLLLLPLLLLLLLSGDPFPPFPFAGLLGVTSSWSSIGPPISRLL